VNTPYNNGKVQIGKYYQPPKYVEQDPDMILIQGWFIGDNKAARRRYWANFAYIVLLVVTFVLMLLNI
jgi:hypothetical protein